MDSLLNRYPWNTYLVELALHNRKDLSLGYEINIPMNILIRPPTCRKENVILVINKGNMIKILLFDDSLYMSLACPLMDEGKKYNLINSLIWGGSDNVEGKWLNVVNL